MAVQSLHSHQHKFLNQNLKKKGLYHFEFSLDFNLLSNIYLIFFAVKMQII